MREFLNVGQFSLNEINHPLNLHEPFFHLKKTLRAFQHHRVNGHVQAAFGFRLQFDDPPTHTRAITRPGPFIKRHGLSPGTCWSWVRSGPNQ